MPKESAGGSAAPKKRTVKKTLKKKATKKVAAKKVTQKTAAKKASLKKTVTKQTSTKAKPKAKKASSAKKRTASKKQKGTAVAVAAASKDCKVREVALEQLFKKQTKQTVSEKTEKPLKLPLNMSARSIEKVLAINVLLSDRVAERVRKGAYGLSFAFLLVGALYSGTAVLSTIQTDGQAANLTSADGTSTTKNTLPEEPILKPEFSLLAPLPSVIESEVRVDFKLAHADSTEVVLRNTYTGEKQFLATKQIRDFEYNFIIPGAGLTPAAYEVRVIARSVHGVFDFQAGKFVVPKRTSNQTATENEPSTTADAETAGTAVVQEQLLVEDSNNAGTVVSKESVDRFAFSVHTDVLETSTMLFLQVPPDVSKVRLYAQREGSYTAQFLGSAQKDAAVWRMYMDVTNIPNGVYQLYAKGIRSDFEVESVRKTITIDKPPLRTAYTESVTAESSASSTLAREVTNRIPQESIGPEGESVRREFSELSLLPETETSEESEIIATELLRSRKGELEVLLRNYSVATQSRDAIALQLAQEALDDFTQELQRRDEIVSQATAGKVAARLTSLRNRIDTFEELRRSKSDAATAVDSDNDGISDVDERTLFKTDPDNPDTDEDGVTDGVEIMRGYNPQNAAPEAVVFYESPRESIGLTRPDSLRITKVNPYIAVENQAERTVQASISGEALPNTYVTLYVFSTPTIITVKTDDTGAFTYTFTDELEDGQHEVYVAITDNAGEIVAQSESFIFVKEAEAFTAGPLTDVSAAMTEDAQEAPYSLALALGILSLGIILLMLGIGLRQPAPAVVT